MNILKFQIHHRFVIILYQVIILEKTKDDVLKITTAYQAPKANYKSIIALAAQGNYGLELMRGENSRDTYYLDKIVQSFSKPVQVQHLLRFLLG